MMQTSAKLTEEKSPILCFKRRNLSISKDRCKSPNFYIQIFKNKNHSNLDYLGNQQLLNFNFIDKKEDQDLNKTFIKSENRHINVEEFAENYTKISEKVRSDLKYFGKLRLFSPDKLQNIMHKIRDLKHPIFSKHKLNILDIMKSSKINTKKQSCNDKNDFSNLNLSNKEKLELPTFTQRNNSHSYANDVTPRLAYSRKDKVLNRNKEYTHRDMPTITPREARMKYSAMCSFNDNRENAKTLCLIDSSPEIKEDNQKINKRLIFRLLSQIKS